MISVLYRQYFFFLVDYIVNMKKYIMKVWLAIQISLGVTIKLILQLIIIIYNNEDKNSELGSS